VADESSTSERPDILWAGGWEFAAAGLFLRDHRRGLGFKKAWAYFFVVDRGQCALLRILPRNYFNCGAFPSTWFRRIDRTFGRAVISGCVRSGGDDVGWLWLLYRKRIFLRGESLECGAAAGAPQSDAILTWLLLRLKRNSRGGGAAISVNEPIFLKQGSLQEALRRIAAKRRRTVKISPMRWRVDWPLWRAWV